MTPNDQIQAILDLVHQNPLGRTVTFDADGNKRVSYQVLPLGKTIPFDEIVQSQNKLFFFKSGTVYGKYTLVRKGLNDYLSLEQTSADPEAPGSAWVLVRANEKGAPGPDGENTTITTDYED